MIRHLSLAVPIVALSAAAHAETVEVKMLNRGEYSSMAYEPDYMELKPGDAIHFVASNKSHNAVSIDGMVPDGYEGFKGKINEEITVSFD